MFSSESDSLLNRAVALGLRALERVARRLDRGAQVLDFGRCLLHRVRNRLRALGLGALEHRAQRVDGGVQLRDLLRRGGDRALHLGLLVGDAALERIARRIQRALQLFDLALTARRALQRQRLCARARARVGGWRRQDSSPLSGDAITGTPGNGVRSASRRTASSRRPGAALNDRR
jgi:hypothetical protein